MAEDHELTSNINDQTHQLPRDQYMNIAIRKFLQQIIRFCLAPKTNEPCEENFDEEIMSSSCYGAAAI